MTRLISRVNTVTVRTSIHLVHYSYLQYSDSSAYLNIARVGSLLGSRKLVKAAKAWLMYVNISFIRCIGATLHNLTFHTRNFNIF